MVSSFFHRIGQALSGKPFVETAIGQLFGKALGSSLGSQIGSYVADGEKSSVLSDLSVNSVQLQWRNRARDYRKPDEGSFFNDVSNWRVDQMRRLGEVLAILEPITYDWGFFGSKQSPDWLRHAVSLWLGRERKKQPLAVLQALAADGGLNASAVVDILFSRDAFMYQNTTSVERFVGVDDWLKDDAAQIIEAAGKASAQARSELAAAIARSGLHEHYAPLLLDMAMGSAKGPRKAANQALTGADSAFLESTLEAEYGQAPPAKRVLLVETIVSTMGKRAAPLIARLRDGESTASVLTAMDRFAGAAAAASPQEAGRNPWEKDGKSGYRGAHGEWVGAPPFGELPERAAIGEEARELAQRVAEAYNTRIEAEQKRYANVQYHWSRSYKTVSPSSALSELRKVTEGNSQISEGYRALPWLNMHFGDKAALERLLDHPGISLRHLVRISLAQGTRSFGGLFGQYANVAALALQRRLAGGADPRVLYALWRENGGPEFLPEYLAARWYFDGDNLPPEVWPIFLEELGILDEAMGLTPQDNAAKYNVSRALNILQLFPVVPDRYRPRLMILANETASGIREKARELLADAPGIEDAIALQLDDGKQDVRAQAADWLVKRGATGHISAIRKRLKTERSDKARAAMITALERLGDDTSDFFDQKAMLKEAQAGLKKAPPKGLEWFGLDALPALSWADGRPVDSALPKYWVVLATRLKETSGNALIDLWLDRLAPGDAHKLGWMILTGWIAQDTRTPTDEEANAHALANVDSVLANNKIYAQRWPQSADYFSTDYNTVFAQLKRNMASNYLGTATASKGMLALASRVEGSDAAPRIRAFLKDHGSRTSQAKALLDVLANIGTPAALQVLLSTADRLKQKSVQAHASQLIERIAERYGWTAAELADRTVPTGGLDEDGVLELDCGPNRLYTARLDEEDKLILLNAAGKEVKALPPARMDDENAIVAQSKKLLSTARKEVKQVVAAQTDRFREAMCMERSWPAEDWRSYVAMHPVVGRLAARLVWLGLDKDEKIVTSFRPLGDGTFSDVADEDVDPANFERIKLAHSTLLDNATSQAWRTHLADYSVTPLFDQLGRSLPTVTPEMRSQRSITDREGWMIETFRLRTVAGKLGYQRGNAEDGGWFLTYNRNLREAGLVAEIEFTGSALPEENIPAALIGLSFRRLLPNGRSGTQVDFGDVPEVLLAETWRDLHDIAEKGSGFDPDWQKKAGI